MSGGLCSDTEFSCPFVSDSVTHGQGDDSHRSSDSFVLSNLLSDRDTCE